MRNKLQWSKVNFLANKFSITPIIKRAKILKRFLNLAGFFVVVAKGIAMPIMNRNEGKMRSAGVRPFH